MEDNNQSEKEFLANKSIHQFWYSNNNVSPCLDLHKLLSEYKAQLIESGEVLDAEKYNAQFHETAKIMYSEGIEVGKLFPTPSKVITDKDLHDELKKNSHSPWSIALWVRDQLTGGAYRLLPAPLDPPG